jgi:hypothetical protein
MREAFFLSKRKIRVASIADAHEMVSKIYPGCHREGSVCHWFWFVKQLNNIVAEAWIVHGKKGGWWLTMKDKPSIGMAATSPPSPTSYRPLWE